MRKLLKITHLWLSIPAGVIITLMCLTGAVLVFQEETLHTLYPERYTVRDSGIQAPLPLDQLVEKVNASLTADTVIAIQVNPGPAATYVATLASGQRSHAYVDPYTGEITGYYNYRAGFFHQVMRLHRWLMFTDTATGRIITGVSTICFVVILVTGIVVWWPRRNKFKRSFFTVKWKYGTYRRWFDLHRVVGLYAGLALLVLSLTGLMWSFTWYRNSVSAIFGVEVAAESSGHGHGGGGSARGGRGGGERSQRPADWWQQAYAAAETQVGESQYIRIAQNGTVTVLPADAPHPRATDSYRYDGRSRELQTVSRYGEDRKQSYLMTWAYALHVGSWGGWFSKILTFLAALIGASLPVTGYVLWFRRKKGRECITEKPVLEEVSCGL